MHPYRRVIVLALIALLAAAAVTLTMPVAVRYVIDAGLTAEQAASIDAYFIALLALATLLAAFTALRFYLVSWLGERVVADIRSAVFHRVMQMGPTFFEVTRSCAVLPTSCCRRPTGSALYRWSAAIALRRCG